MVDSVLVFSNFFLPGYKGGGPIKTIENMTKALGSDYRFFIVTGDRDLGDSGPYEGVDSTKWNKLGEAWVYYVRRGFLGVGVIASILKNTKFDVVHLNSFFSIRFGLLPLIFSRFFRPDAPVILGPRGEFSPGALRIKSLKKRVFILFFKIFRLHRGIIWHASSTYEAADIRRTIGSSAVVRTAIDITVSKDSINLVPRAVQAPLKVIFVSRISEKKNLLGAIEILQQVVGEISFDVYGPIEDEVYWNKCLAAVSGLQNNSSFNYRGPLSPDRVIAVMAEYDLFLFPTFGENYGHVIAEALHAGLPVLLSDETPWRGLEEKMLGWDLPLSMRAAFVECVEQCCQKSSLEYHAWRKSIRAWAIENIGGLDAIRQNKELFANKI